MTNEQMQAEILAFCDEFGLELENGGLEVMIDEDGDGQKLGVGFKLTKESAAKLDADPVLNIKVRRAKTALINKATGSGAVFRYEPLEADDVRINPDQEDNPPESVKMCQLTLVHNEMRMLWGFAQIGVAFTDGMLALNRLISEGTEPTDPRSPAALMKLMDQTVTEMQSQFQGPAHVSVAHIKMDEIADMLQFASNDVDEKMAVEKLEGVETLADLGWDMPTDE